MKKRRRKKKKRKKRRRKKRRRRKGGATEDEDGLENCWVRVVCKYLTLIKNGRGVHVCVCLFVFVYVCFCIHAWVNECVGVFVYFSTVYYCFVIIFIR